MRIKLLQPYKRLPAGAVADFLQPLADQLISENKAVWVPQDTACKTVNAELYDRCTAPIPAAKLELSQKTVKKPKEEESSKSETQASEETAQGGTPEKRNFLNF